MSEHAPASPAKPQNQNPEKSKQIVAQVHREELSYSGPIPPPSMLAEYNKIVPDAAKILIQMAVDQSNHRQYLEKKIIDSDITNSRLGVIFAFIIAMAFLAGAVIGALNNHPVFGGLLGTGGLTGLVGVFIYGTNARKQERQENKQESKEPPRK